MIEIGQVHSRAAVKVADRDDGRARRAWVTGDG